MNEAIETLRRQLVGRLTAREDTAWTVTADRFVVRRGGRVLCKVGRDDEHVLVEFPIPKGAGEAVDASPFTGPTPKAEGDPERWRQARLSTEGDIDTLLGWLLPE